MSDPKVLPRTQFGNPILRKVTTTISVKDIKSAKIQELIQNMRHTLISKKLGVGLAAPQVGNACALAVIAVRRSKVRPDAEPFDLVIINPEIIETYGRKAQLWEGCISAGSNGQADLFAKVPRYSKLKLGFYDENGDMHTEVFGGFAAHVIQHEVDHLNGILFVDKVKDTNTFMTYREYLKMKSTETGV